MRPRLSLLVAFSALMGYLLTGDFAVVVAVMLMTGVFLLSAGSSALNQYQERQLDALMPRTRRRPIPSGSIAADTALVTACSLIVAGTLVLYLISPAAMWLGLINIGLYNGIYTPLKAKTPLSILPGALVGAVPPLMGWSAGSAFLWHPHILFVALFMFLWQIPHFWLLITMYGKEYEQAGFPTISRYFSHNRIKTIVFLWGLFTSLFLFLHPLFYLHFPLAFVLTLLIINTLFIVLFYRFLFKSPENLFSAFITINSFMTLVLVLFVIARFAQWV